MAEYVELYIDQGTDFNTTINLNDDDTNLPQNVQGYVVTGYLRRSLISTNTSGQFVCNVDNAANGEITLEITAANTANLKAGRHFFDIRIVDTLASNATSRLLEGIIIVNPAITR